LDVLLEPVDGVEVLPEPMPLPELADPGVVGVVVAPPLVLLPMPELDEPEPALPVEGLVVDELPVDELRSSRRQLSRCAPVRPMHLLTSLPDAPEAAPVVPEVLPGVEVLVSLELEDEAPDDGSVVLLPADEPLAEGAVVVLPDEPDEPMPVLPLLEPEDWANAAPDRARSAAAVAAVSVFNIMREISFEGWMNAAEVGYARVMPLAREKFFRAAGMPSFVQAASCASPRQ
jgi:hypothetical protein